MTSYFKPWRQGLAASRFTKALARLLFGFLTVWSSAMGQCVAPPPGLVLWHPLDDLDSGVVGGAGAIDANGILFQPGRVRQAMVLGGAGSGMIVNVNENQLNLGSFTVEGWIQRRQLGVSSTDGEGGVIFGGGPSGMAFAMLRDGRLTLSAGGVTRVDSEASIIDLDWHHVAVTRSGSTVTFFIDGLVGGSLDYAAVFTPSTAYGIGKFASPVLGLTGTFLGSLDEVSVYQGALSLSAIRSIHAAGASGKCGPEVSVAELFVIPTVSRDSEFVAECLILPVGLTNPQNVEVQFSLSGGLSFVGGSASVGSLVFDTNSATVRVASLPVAVGTRIRLTLKSGAPGVSEFTLRLKDREITRAINVVPACSSAPGVVGYWPLDESAVDLIGGGTGTLRGTARWVVGRGGNGRALEVNGNADALVVANPQALGLDVFSVEMWVRRGSLERTTQNGIAGVIAAGTDGSYSVALSPDGNLMFSQVAVVLAPIPTRIQDLAWHHLVMVREEGALAFYLDGALAGRASFAGTFGPTSAFAIGSLPVPSFGINYGFVGAIDDFTVWNRRLGEAEIQAHATAASASFCSAELELETLASSNLVPPGSTNRFSWRLRNTGASVAEGVVISNVWTTVLGVAGAESSKGTVEISQGGLRVLVGRLIPGESVELAMDGFAKGSGAAVLTSKAFLGSDLLTALGSTEANIDVGLTCSAPIAGLESLYRGEGDLTDATGLHPGVQEGSLGFAAGRVGEAFDFKGAGGVAVPDSAWLNRQDFTVDAWVYPTAYNGMEDIIVNREASATSLQTIQFEMGIRGPLDPVGTIPIGNLAVFVSGLNGMPSNHNGWTDTGAAVPLNRWSHVALAVEPGRVRVFLNGAKVSEFTGLTGVMPSMDAPFRIGARSQTFFGWEAERFDGRIDEVGVYKRALLNEEVASLFAAGAAGRCGADLRLAWEGVPGTLAAGESFLARLVVENPGNQPLSPVTLTNTIPAGWSVTALTTSVGTVTLNAGTITGEFGILAGGAKVAVDMVIRADVAQDASLVARGYSQTTELSLSNNEAVARVVVAPLTLTVLDAARSEGGTGQRLILQVPVRLSAAVSRTVSVDYAVGPPRPGTGRPLAVAGVDFEPVSGRLEFGPGEIEKTVSIVILGDGFFEPDEVFGFVVSNPVGVVIEGLLPVLTIVNDDPVPQISVADVRVTEGDSGTKDMVFPVTMTGLAGVDLEIVWSSTNETARSPFDFAGGTGTVVIPSGSTHAEIRIPVVGDLTEEPNEFFTLNISSAPSSAEVIFTRSVALGIVINDDRSPGVVRGFEWVTPPSAIAGVPFAAQLRAVDGLGGVVSNFNGVVALAGIPAIQGGGNELPSQLLITEVDTRTTDAVELQNVTAGDLDVSGWRVSFYDFRRWPVPRATFVVPTGTVMAAGSLFRIQEGTLAPNTFPRFSLGQPLDWGIDATEDILTTRPMAVMLQDASGALRDFFAANGADPDDIDIPLTVDPTDWPGFPLGGISTLTPRNFNHQRVGWWNRKGADGWNRGLGAIGTQNNQMRVPFVDSRLVPVAPSVVATFTDGSWVGTLTLGSSAGFARLLADDGAGRLGVSEGIAVASSGDLRIATFDSAAPFAVQGREMVLRIVVTNEAAVAATGVTVDLPFETELGLIAPRITLLKTSQGTLNFVPPNAPSQPRAMVLANVGTLPAGGSVTLEVGINPGAVTQRLPLMMVAEARRAGGTSGSGIDRAELQVELGTGLVQERANRLAWWRAEGDAKDILGNHDGVASGVVYGRRYDQRTFQFDGGDAVIEVPSGGGLKPRPASGFTLSAWLRARPGQRERQVVAEFSGGTNGAGFALILRNGKPSIEWDGQWIGTTGFAPDIRDGDWHYVSWTLIQGQPWLTVRIDGLSAIQATSTLLGKYTGVGDGPLRIGRGASGGGFDGELDEIVIYGAGQSTGTHNQDYLAGALGQSLSDTRVTLGRQVSPPPSITVGRPSTLTLIITNQGPVRVSNLDLDWKNSQFATVSEIRRDGVLIPSTRFGADVEEAALGAFEVGQNSLLTITFQVNRDIAQLSSLVTLSAGLRDRVASLSFLATVLADPDGDGVPSSWESAYGLDPADPLDAFVDRDGDGFGARAEYDAGTDPTSATSFPSVSWRTGEGGTLVLQVQTTADRDYRLERTVTLRGPAGWELLERRAGTGEILEFVIPAAPDVDQSYYQVRPVPLW